MRKIFFTTVVALILSLQNFCGAAITIDSGHFNGNKNLIYPIVRTDNPTVDTKINAVIVAEIRRFVYEVYASGKTYDTNVESVNTSFKVPCNRAGNTVILSILITESSSKKGAAHPSTYLRALNFNLETGELMNWSYLTDIGSGNENFSLDNITKKLREKAEHENITLLDEMLPLKKLPEEFYWDENLHVHLIFQQDEVAPYAAGIIDLDMNS